MHCYLFQNWVTLRGGPSAQNIQSIPQSEPGWLDLAPYQDVVFWLDVREVTPPTGSNPLLIDFQTAPVLDNAYFSSVVNATGGLPLTAGSTPTVQRAIRTQTYTPLARYLRWYVNTGGITPTQTWDVTMRIWAATNYALPATVATRTGVASVSSQPNGITEAASQLRDLLNAQATSRTRSPLAKT